MTRWLRNKQQRERYGVESNRTLERMRKDGRLPRPGIPSATAFRPTPKKNLMRTTQQSSALVSPDALSLAPSRPPKTARAPAQGGSPRRRQRWPPHKAHACSISEFQLPLRRSASGYFGPCRANKMPGPAVNGNRAIGITAAMKNLAWPIEFGDTENRFNSDFDLENSKIFAADVACAPAPPINSPTNSNFPTPISKNTAAPAHALAWGRP
jgi:hypothetical protein